MSKEEFVDGLQTEYEAARLLHPKLGLPEITAKNREFLINSASENGQNYSLQNDQASFDGFVLLGSWSRLDQHQSFKNTTWYKGHLGHNTMRNNDFTGARFIDCQLSNSTFFDANLTNVMFINCSFTRVSMSGAIFDNTKIVRPLVQQYDAISDDLDQIKIGWTSGLFDWAKLRFLSEIPMFSISWSTLLGSLAIMNMIGWGSLNRDKISSVVEPLSMPSTLIELFIAAFFLATAATCYAVFCPPRVREISETEWTDKQSKPRLQ